MTAWPPASVWVAAAATANPLLGTVGVSLWLNTPPPGPVLGLTAGAVAVAAGLLVGGVPARAAWWLVGFAAVLTGCGGLAVLTATLPGSPPGVPELTTGTAFLAIGVTQAVALWWPATRRWCGPRQPRLLEPDA